MTATRIGIGPREDGTGFGLDVALSIALPGIDKAKAEELVQAAHIVCPYSPRDAGQSRRSPERSLKQRGAP